MRRRAPAGRGARAGPPDASTASGRSHGVRPWPGAIGDSAAGGHVGLMIERRTLWAMAVGCGLAVANLYYAQPLLADMGRYFGTTDRRMGLVAMLSQVGYALGLLLFVPLGDRLERRAFFPVAARGGPVGPPGGAAAPPIR